MATSSIHAQIDSNLGPLRDWMYNSLAGYDSLKRDYTALQQRCTTIQQQHGDLQREHHAAAAELFELRAFKAEMLASLWNQRHTDMHDARNYTDTPRTPQPQEAATTTYALAHRSECARLLSSSLRRLERRDSGRSTGSSASSLSSGSSSRCSRLSSLRYDGGAGGTHHDRASQHAGSGDEGWEGQYFYDEAASDTAGPGGHADRHGLYDNVGHCQEGQRLPAHDCQGLNTATATTAPRYEYQAQVQEQLYDATAAVLLGSVPPAARKRLPSPDQARRRSSAPTTPAASADPPATHPDAETTGTAHTDVPQACSPTPRRRRRTSPKPPTPPPPLQRADSHYETPHAGNSEADVDADAGAGAGEDAVAGTGCTHAAPAMHAPATTSTAAATAATAANPGNVYGEDTAAPATVTGASLHAYDCAHDDDAEHTRHTENIYASIAEMDLPPALTAHGSHVQAGAGRPAPTHPRDEAPPVPRRPSGKGCVAVCAQAVHLATVGSSNTNLASFESTPGSLENLSKLSVC